MSDHKTHLNDPRRYWLDDANNRKKLLGALFIVGALLFLADAVYHKHPYFSAENWFGFYAVYGFIACIVFVLLARVFGAILTRDAEYYEKDE